MGRPQRIEPGPGQESVWDYPRPPRLEPTAALVRVVHAGRVVAETRSALRVLETSQPPGYYLPTADVDLDLLRPSPQHTFCEWKGVASYHHLVVPGTEAVVDAAWSYPTPSPAFSAIAGHLAFYPQKVQACFVDDEQVDANEGSFYGGLDHLEGGRPVQGRRRLLGLVAPIRCPRRASPGGGTLRRPWWSAP